jgi:ribosomal protein S18 acetylase RimI-like enzyme
VIVIRRATADDALVLRQMLAIAADWRPGSRLRSNVEVMAVPDLARYVADWPRHGDIGFVAQAGSTNVGAGWWRRFSEHDRGFGFVDEETPELSIGVVRDARGRGVGTLLLGALIDEAQRRRLPALSLSVEPDNPAVSLYERLGFVVASRMSGSLTMVLSLGE